MNWKWKIIDGEILDMQVMVSYIYGNIMCDNYLGTRAKMWGGKNKFVTC